MVSFIERFHCIQDSQLGPNGGHYRETPLYKSEFAKSVKCICDYLLMNWLMVCYFVFMLSKQRNH